MNIIRKRKFFRRRDLDRLISRIEKPLSIYNPLDFDEILGTVFEKKFTDRHTNTLNYCSVNRIQDIKNYYISLVRFGLSCTVALSYLVLELSNVKTIITRVLSAYIVCFA